MRTDLLRMLAAQVFAAFEGDADLNVVREFSAHANERIWAQIQHAKDTVSVDVEELRSLALFFLVLEEALNPRGSTKIRVKFQNRRGRPRLSSDERLRRAEAAAIVEENLRTGVAANQVDAIKSAIKEMKRRGLGERLSVRIVERALQRERRLHRV